MPSEAGRGIETGGRAAAQELPVYAFGGELGPSGQPGARRADEVEIPLAVEDRRDEGELGYIPDQIPAGWEVVLETGERIKTRIPVPIFLLKEVNYAVADLRGHNMLYSEHETPEGAIEALLILMFSYHQDFRKQAGSPFGPALAQLRDDLTNIFG